MSGDFIRRESLGLTDFEIIMCDGDYKEGLKLLLEKIENAPAADVVEVVHARPVKFYCNAMTGRMITTCSACDRKIGPYDSFCKHCGAKMDGG